MAYSVPTQEEATTLAQRLNETRIGHYAHAGHDRKVTNHIVKPHRYQEGTHIPMTWGVVERWTYIDRPDLGELGGAFLPLDFIKRVINP